MHFFLRDGFWYCRASSLRAVLSCGRESKPAKQRGVGEVSVNGTAAAVQLDGAVALAEHLDRDYGVGDKIVSVHVFVHYGEHEQGNLRHDHLED